MDFLSTRALSFSLKSVLCRNKNLPFKCEVRCLPLPPAAARTRPPPREAVTHAGCWVRPGPRPQRGPPVSPPVAPGAFPPAARTHPFARVYAGAVALPSQGPSAEPAGGTRRGGQLGGARWPPEPRRTVSSRLCAVTRAAVTEPTARRSLGGHRACARARARIPSLLSARGWLANDLRWHASCRRESRPRGLLPPGARLPF